MIFCLKYGIISLNLLLYYKKGKTMNFINKMWNKLKTPSKLFAALFCTFFVLILTATLLLVILVPEQTLYHFILYPISALALTYFVYLVVRLSPKIKNNIIKMLKKHKFTSELLDNYGYRTIIFSVISFIINLAYVNFMGVLAIMTRSVWYISITAYYLVLTIMKGNVFYSKKKHGLGIYEEKTYRYTGVMFIFLTIALSGIIVLIYKSNMYFEYAGLMIYAVATFTFYKLILAIFNIFKARKQDDLYIQTIRNINLANALFSVIVLQVALFQAFSPELNTSFANGLTAGGVSLVILILGVFMIVKANKV